MCLTSDYIDITLMNLCLSLLPWKEIEIKLYRAFTNKKSLLRLSPSPGTKGSKQTFVSMLATHNASLANSIKYNSIITEINI